MSPDRHNHQYFGMLPDPAIPVGSESPRHPQRHSRHGTSTFTDLSPGGNRAFHNFFNDFSHIQDPNLRRRLALSEIDKIPLGLYHVRAVLVAGIGFFLDSYDIFAINLITSMLGIVFWQGAPEDAVNGYGGNYGNLPGFVGTTLKASTSAGIVIGQVLFGWLSDVFGRRRMYGVELGIIIVSTLACCLVAPSQAVSFTGVMTFWRVAMGVGIGGDYPLSSVITSEFAPTRWRGAMMAAVFSMQGIGQLVAAITTLVVTMAFKEHFEGAMGVDQCDYDCQIAADRCWRIIVGFGALPACFALYYRITIPETPRYTFEIAKDIEKASADVKAYMASQGEGDVDEIKQARMKKVASPALDVPSASWRDVCAYFGQWKNLKILIGTTSSWFFLDLAFYGLGLNNSIVLDEIGYSAGPTVYTRFRNTATGMIILTVAGSLPGYWTAVLTIDTLGRKPLQVFGFLCLTIIFCVLGFCYHSFSPGALLALYVVAQFFFNWGPNTTTFIVPGECFPTRYRSTGHGLSAAMGKIGAIIAQVISAPLLATDSSEECANGTQHGVQCSVWIDRLMQIFALFMLCGLMTSLLIPETKGVTLEELAGEQPTSYNAGRHGSETPPPPRWWNSILFRGGRPAGFRVKKSNHHLFFAGSSGGGSSRKIPRMGIMHSPEMGERAQSSSGAAAAAAEGTEALSHTTSGTTMIPRRSRWAMRKNRKNKRRPASVDSGATSAGILPGGPVPHAGVLPGWGAGWGRVDRGGNPIAMENIRLQDVGSLLK